MKIKLLCALVLMLGGTGSLLADSAPALSPTAQASVAKKTATKKAAPAKKDKKAKLTAAPAALTATAAVASAPVKKQHWVCPMHDGGESDHPGKCPKCGMDLELEKD